MVWYLNAPWDRIVIGIILVVIGVFQFWQHLDVYEHMYSPSRAVGMASAKAAYWIACYGLAFIPVFLVVSRFLEPGWLRDVIGGGSWWLVSSILNELVWKPLSRMVDNLLG